MPLKHGRRWLIAPQRPRISAAYSACRSKRNASARMSEVPLQTQGDFAAQPPMPVHRLHNFIYSRSRREFRNAEAAAGLNIGQHVRARAATRTDYQCTTESFPP